MILKCACGQTIQIPDTCNLGEKAKNAPGWGYVWDISNGLNDVWLCPTHADRTRGLLVQISDMFNIPLEDLNLLPLIRKVKQ